MIGTAGTLLVVPRHPPAADMVVTETGPEETCLVLSADVIAVKVAIVEIGTITTEKITTGTTIGVTAPVKPLAMVDGLTVNI